MSRDPRRRTNKLAPIEDIRAGQLQMHARRLCQVVRASRGVNRSRASWLTGSIHVDRDIGG
jgi:hypothetical protein